jgi:MFS family permease
MAAILKDGQYYKFCLYGFLKNLRFFDPFIILFFREQGFLFVQIGALFAIREITTNVLEIPTGILADAYGRRRAMVFSFLSYIVSFFIFYFFPVFGLYAAAMVFFALGEAFRTGTHKAMILDYLRLHDMTDVRVAYYGHTRSCSQIGSALSALIAAALVLYSGSYRVVFLASVIPYLAALGLMLSYPAVLEGTSPGPAASRRLRDILSRAGGTVSDFFAIFRDPRFLRIVFSSASFDAVFKTVKDYIQPILQASALALPLLVSASPNRRVALLTGAVYCLLYLLTSYAARSAGRLNERVRSLPRTINRSYLGGGLLIAAVGASLQLGLSWLSVGIFILFYMLQNLRRPFTVGYISELIANRVMASGLSGESQVKTILVALLAPLMGLLADAIGVAGALLCMGALLLVLSPFLRVGRESAAP